MPKEDLTYVLPSLDKWTEKHENVPLELTGGKIQPSFIPNDGPFTFKELPDELSEKDYIYLADGWYHVSVRKVWTALASHYKAREQETRETYVMCAQLSMCLVCIPFYCYFAAKNSQYDKYHKLALRRSEMEAPNGMPKHKHKGKYQKFYTKEGHWIVPHQMH